MRMILLFIILFSLEGFAGNLSTLIGGGGSSALHGRTEFDRDSTWVVPTGISTIYVEVIGAGGGAGMAYSAGVTYGAGGGGGGGSCVKNGAATLASADGGRGGHWNERQGQPGSVTRASAAVTAGGTLNIYVGGGGGGVGTNYTGATIFAAGGGGGYGNCGSGGVGGNGNLAGATGGTGGADKGGGAGGSTMDNTTPYVGANAASSTGGSASAGVYGGAGGAATVGGVTTGLGGGGGGASGGAGGAGGYRNATDGAIYEGGPGLYASNKVTTSGNPGATAMNCNISVPMNPGEAGYKIGTYPQCRHSTGGGPGRVIITW